MKESRAEYVMQGTPEQLFWYKQQRLKELCAHIERVVLFRCLPFYKKEIDGRSRMWSCEVPMELWNDLLVQLTSNGNPKVNEKKIKYPDQDLFVRKNK